MIANVGVLCSTEQYSVNWKKTVVKRLPFV